MNLTDDIGLLTIQEEREITISRKRVGWLLTHKDGHKIVLVRRTLKDFVLDRGETMISHALALKRCGLPLERALLSKASRAGAVMIAVHILQQKKLYCTTVENYLRFSRGGDKVRNKRGLPQRALNVKYFKSQTGVGKIDDCLPDYDCLKVSHQIVIEQTEEAET